MELEDLKELIGLLKETDITEFQIEKDGIKVKIKREKFFSHPDMKHPVFMEKKETKALDEPAAEGPEGSVITVTSPIVGTFYRSSSPDTKPFVEVGEPVKKGQVLCIIEAMKLMNEIESDTDGILVKALVENGHSVEYGEPLFLIEPI